MTTAEDDLLYCLLHDVRLGRSLAQIIDPSWLDTKVVAGRILAKIFAEVLADGSLNTSEMEELLETDEERFHFQSLLFQESDDDSEKEILEISNHCIAVIFSRFSRILEKDLLENLKNFETTSTSNVEIRTKLKEIRTSRKSPPKISEIELEPIP